MGNVRRWQLRGAMLFTLAMLTAHCTSAPAQHIEHRDAPRVLVSGWLSNDSLSRATAESVAVDLRRLLPYPKLFVISGQEIERELAGHWDLGADAMTSADLREVGKLVRADAIVDLATKASSARIDVLPLRMRRQSVTVDTLPAFSAVSEREVAARLAQWLAAEMER